MSEIKKKLKTPENFSMYEAKVRKKLKINRERRKSYTKLHLEKSKKIGKTICKSSLLNDVYVKLGKAVPYIYIEAVFAVAVEAIIDELGEDRPVLIKNFGTFSILYNQYTVKYKRVRMGKGYIGGTEVSYPKVVFRPAKAFNVGLKRMRKLVKDGLLEKSTPMSKKSCPQR